MFLLILIGPKIVQMYKSVQQLMSRQHALSFEKEKYQLRPPLRVDEDRKTRDNIKNTCEGKETAKLFSEKSAWF